MSLSEQNRALVDREAIARIIDPEAWDEISADDNVEVAAIFAEAWEEALAKADQILARCAQGGGDENALYERGYSEGYDEGRRDAIREMQDAALATPNTDTPAQQSDHFAGVSNMVATQQSGGWVLVPREPTEAMNAAAKAFRKGVGESAERLYRAMIAAAPPPPGDIGGKKDMASVDESTVSPKSDTPTPSPAGGEG